MTDLVFKRAMNGNNSGNEFNSTAGTRTLAFIITTSLAAAFNMLMVLVICLVVMPGVTRTGNEIEKNRDTISSLRSDLADMKTEIRKLNHEIIVSRKLSESVTSELAEHRSAIRRFNIAVENWETILKKAKEAKEKKEKQ